LLLTLILVLALCHVFCHTCSAAAVVGARFVAPSRWLWHDWERIHLFGMVWKFLLDVYPFHSTLVERQSIDLRHRYGNCGITLTAWPTPLFFFLFFSTLVPFVCTLIFPTYFHPIHR